MNLSFINFHYIREIKPPQGIYPKTISEFSEQIKKLSENYVFLNQEEVIEGFFKPSDRNMCVITFDDGLKEQIKAVEYLHSKNIRPICFVSMEPLTKSIVLETHKLHVIRSLISDQDFVNKVKKINSFTRFDVDKSILLKQYRYDSFDIAKAKYFLNFKLERPEKKEFLDSLFIHTVGMKESEFSEKFYMNKNDLINLSKIADIGSHAVSHTPLGSLSSEEALKEMKESKAFLDDIIGKPIKSISYPFGGRSALPKVTDSEIENLGYEFGLTMIRGSNDLPLSNSKYFLRRYDTNDL
tara:strand:- start:10357 stop:11247 length:891 start_codon:yes stop_codon:yes gene_type:complete